MHCIQIREQLELYLDDELLDDARQEVEAHLSTCPACTEELASLRALAEELGGGKAVVVPDTLWPSIERRLLRAPEGRPIQLKHRGKLQLLRRPLAAAASIALLIGLGLIGFTFLEANSSRAQASTIDFSALLDALPLDAQKAFRDFLMEHDAEEIEASGAHRHAPNLTFEVPASLPGGFNLEAVYTLRFGKSDGIAAEYSRDGEFLATLFHPPVRREDFGTYQDIPCVIGSHRGRTVKVGPWRMVHLADPTTCHCLLTKLDVRSELHAVMAAVVPGLPIATDHQHTP